jgi:hypothetical protein
METNWKDFLMKRVHNRKNCLQNKIINFRWIFKLNDIYFELFGMDGFFFENVRVINMI